MPVTFGSSGQGFCSNICTLLEIYRKMYKSENQVWKKYFFRAGSNPGPKFAKIEVYQPIRSKLFIFQNYYLSIRKNLSL